MLLSHNLAVLSLFALNSCAEAGLLVGGRNAVAEPQYSPVSQASSQSSEGLFISSLLASLSSVAAAAQTSSEAASTSIISTSSIPPSSTTSTIAETSSSVVATSSTSFSTSISSSISSSISTSISASIPMTTPSATPTGVTTPTAAPSSSIAAASTSSSSSTIDSRTRTIILATCLAFLGLILLMVALILLRRYRRRQSPFSPFTRRGASPIDDDEIATWRGNSQPMAKTPSMHVRSASSIVFQPQPGLTWTGSSSPESSSPESSSPATSPPPPGSGEALHYPPPALVAQAPNARSGLTDGVIPGDAPFVTPARRQSRRLSKAVSAGHVRSKSRRSSVSVSSIREPRTSTSNGQWAEPEDWDVQRKRSNSAPRTPKTALGRTSMGDDVRLGGLSPRPLTAADLPRSEIPGSAY